MMQRTNFLDQIVAQRRRQIAAEKAGRTRATSVKGTRRLRAALRAKDRIHIIAEFKRASPSAGWIRKDANAEEMAMLYELAGASAISVLTEPDFFRGSIEDLRAVRVATELPILRKDFIVDEFQIEEAAEAEADAILLIVAALSDDELLRLRKFAEDQLGLDALVEVHTAEEMERAKNCGALLIGVNNRDLQTFVTSLETSVQLAAHAPAGATLVSESGITSASDVARLRECGYHGFLVGESLLRAPDPGELLKSLLQA